MSGLPPNYFGLASRTPHGVRGLKFPFVELEGLHERGRTPHGVRGLKSTDAGRDTVSCPSHPSRGAWIEIPKKP